MFKLEIQPSEKLHTEFGNVKFHKKGYQVTSRKEGNHCKQWHRLIYERFYDVVLPSEIDIHHRDHNPKNNCILNLEAMTHEGHARHHEMSEKNKEALRNANLGNKYCYKDYARIVKDGWANGKQRYALMNKGKKVMRSNNLLYLERQLYRLEGENKNGEKN